jgi:hypothetical protein
MNENEETMTISEVQALLQRLGVTQDVPRTQSDQVLSAIRDAFDDPDEREAFLKHAAKGAEEVAALRRQKAQAGLRASYQEELAKIPRGQHVAITRLQLKYRGLGLDV